MNRENETLTVKRKGQTGSLLFFIFYTGMAVIASWLLISRLFGGALTYETLIVAGLIVAFSTPMALYNYHNAFGKKIIIEIDNTGLTSAKYGILNWEKIDDINVKKYAGPRMWFYIITLVLDGKNGTLKIWLSSDMDTDWRIIIDFLAHYAVKNNINFS